MTWDELCALALELPEVAVDRWYGTPAIKVRGKGFVRLKEDGRSVVFVLESVDEQELLVENRPEVYFITPHYEGYPAVLAHLSRLHAAEARLRLEHAWRQKAPPPLRRARGSGPRPRDRHAAPDPPA